MTTSTPEPTVTAAEIQELRMDFDTYRIHRALDALEAAWAREAQLVAALRAAPRLQLALWYATYGPEVSPEPGRPDYELYKALRSVIAAVDARETEGAEHVG